MNFISLYLPRWLRDGITPNERGARMRKFIYGGDTETMHGEPITFQFYSQHAKRDDLIWIDNPNQASRILLKWCGSLQSNAEHVVYVHNLEFDMVSFFWECKQKLVLNSSGEFEFTHGSWHISGVYGAPTYCKLVNRSNRITVYLVDSFSYYRASLAKAATVFCPDLPKLTRPEGLGDKRFSKRDRQFMRYAMRDAEVAYFIGMSLEALHNEFDLTQTVSVADMAARIFRHRFLDRTIPQPPRSVIEEALNSYHGGKNNVAAPPGWHMGVSSLDISSAYPHAMSEFPSFTVRQAYKRWRGSARTKQVPDLGVYRVTGTVAACDWPVLFGHDFSVLEGRIDDGGVCVQGFELNEALRSGEFKPRSIEGYVYDVDMDTYKPPLKDFVADFYARKEAETDKAKRAMYKFILNSISGKFIQTRKRSKTDYINIESGKMTETSELEAGGMFHPFIASAITAHTRARIHQLEHKYKALHTATDGIFTQAKRLPNEGKHLGALVNEAHGDLLMLRNKLYILYGPEGETESVAFKGKRIIKYAMHGFQGKVETLERMVVLGRRRYDIEKPNRLRDATKRGLTPNDFTKRDYILKVGNLPVHRRK